MTFNSFSTFRSTDATEALGGICTFGFAVSGIL